MKVNLLPLYFFLVMSLILSGCSENGKADKKTGEPVFVLARQAAKTAVDPGISASANIEGSKTVKLGFLVSGRIHSIAVAEGGMLEAGQLLASLDPESYEIAKEMADANLERAEDEYNRLTVMYNRKSLSESDYSKVTHTLRLAKAQQRLQAKNLAETKLYSPIRGVLLKRGVEVGEIIGAGIPLFGISDISTVYANAAVPETDLRDIRIGKTAKVYISSLGSTFTGRVVEIGSVAEPTTRSFTVKIKLKNSRLIIRPGMTAEVKIRSGQKTERITVPGEAVLHDPADNSSYIYVVDKTKNQAFKRKISLGRMAKKGIEVTSGVLPGEWVVVGGQHKLHDGCLVVLK